MSEQGGSSSASGASAGATENQNISVLQELVEIKDLKKQFGGMMNHESSKKKKRSLKNKLDAKTKAESDMGILHQLVVSSTQRMQKVKCNREHLDTNDCDVMFLFCLRDAIKTLTARKATLAKIKIQQILFELQFPDS
ncbi:unnamed protein product [Ixodes persulcatus]